MFAVLLMIMNEDILIEHGCIADTISQCTHQSSKSNLHISPYLHFFKNKIPNFQELEILSKLSLFKLDSRAALSGIPLLSCCSIWHKRYKWSKSFFPLCTDFRCKMYEWGRHFIKLEILNFMILWKNLWPQNISKNICFLRKFQATCFGFGYLSRSMVKYLEHM